MYIFIFIIVCISFVLSLALAVVLRYNYLTTAALFFTVIADIFLIILGRYYAIGLVFFNIVQILYAARIFRNRDDKKTFIKFIVQIALRTITAVIAVIVITLVLEFDLVLILVAIYATNFLYNLIFLSLRFKRDAMFGVGLILFAFCDIFVGLLNLPEYTDIAINRSIVFALMAICYIPSQIIIAVSTAHKQPSPQL